MSELEPAPAAAIVEQATDIVTAPEPRQDSLPGRAQPPQPIAVPGKFALTRLGPVLTEQVQRLGTLGIAGIASLVFCVAFFQSTLMPQYKQVRELRLAVESAEARPAEVRMRPTRTQPDAFVASLPDRDALPAVLGSIVQQAQSAGVVLERGAYQWSAEKSGAVARYQIVLPVSGSYPAVRKFVDSTLLAVPAAALAGITLERPNVGAERVSANLRFEIFVRALP